MLKNVPKYILNMYSKIFNNHHLQSMLRNMFQTRFQPCQYSKPTIYKINFTTFYVKNTPFFGPFNTLKTLIKTLNFWPKIKKNWEKIFSKIFFSNFFSNFLIPSPCLCYSPIQGCFLVLFDPKNWPFLCLKTSQNTY